MAANFTAGPIADSLNFWCRELGWQDETYLAPYNQVLQTLLDPAGAFAENSGGFNLVLLRSDRVDRDFSSELKRAVETYQRRGAAPLIVAFCPGRNGIGEAKAAAALAGFDSVHVIRAEDLHRWYPVADPFDLHAEKLGDIPYSPLFFASLGTAIARTAHAVRMRPYKVIVLDCDNTLWQGTCGEDGPEGVLIDAPRLHLQKFMRAQRDAGMLLAICSKNNESDVLETFRLHTEMPLQIGDFIAHRINWDSKAPNLTSIAEELNLGLDSFIFVDDDSKEIGEVQAARREVLCITLPHDPSRLPHFLDHIWAFDHLRVTDEDRLRHSSYQQQMERGRLERESATLRDFLRQLHLEVHIEPLSERQAPRVGQLTQRTNQMNTSLVRRSEAEVRAIVADSSVECLTVDVNDRFGSYGLVGAIFLTEADDSLIINNLLLSCRALGRGVEHRMVAHLGKIACNQGKRFVDIAFTPGPRNEPAKQFLESLPADRIDDRFRIAADVCAGIRYEPADKIQAADERAKVHHAAPVSSFQDYARIARELSRPAQVLDAIRAEQRGGVRHGTAEPPRTDLERRVAGIWSEVLRVPHPGVNENFFDLGGHSLLAVQLLSRVRQELGVELSLDLVYSGTLTIAGMAAAIDLAQADPEEIERLMAEIDSLSEEEIQALLSGDHSVMAAPSVGQKEAGP